MLWITSKRVSLRRIKSLHFVRLVGQYIDQRCVYYKKPLIDSGTLGTKASVQVVVPVLTESYSSTRDPPDASIPMCLLHHFPNLIEHTIQWARDNFAGLFTNPAQQTEEYLKNPEEFAARTAKNLSPYDRNEIVDNVKRTLGKERPKSFSDCIKWVSLDRPLRTRAKRTSLLLGSSCVPRAVS
jgi:ubiquitin-activating enzyme E1